MYLYGASGHARVIIDILAAGGTAVEALVDDNPGLDTLCGIPVVHNARGLSPMIISIGNNRIRRDISRRLPACRFGTAIHPRATISPSATVGEGTVIMAGATVNAGAVIGRHCIINTNSSVDHECRLGDYVHISPGAALCGNVRVGSGAHIGAGATVVPGIQIGPWATIGAGATVISDIPAGATAVGTPARVTKLNPGANTLDNSELTGGGNLTLIPGPTSNTPRRQAA